MFSRQSLNSGQLLKGQTQTPMDLEKETEVLSKCTSKLIKALKVTEFSYQSRLNNTS